MSTPGSICSIANPEAVGDGTLSLRAGTAPVSLGSQGKPQGGLALVYSCWNDGAQAGEEAIVQVLWRRFDTGVSQLNFQQSLVGNEIHNASVKAQAYVRNVLDKIANAADWNALNKLAQPILGQSSVSAGVLYGVAESLVGDAASLLSLGKMLVLAGIYERIKNASLTLVLDPTSLALAVTVRTVPALWNEARKCDEAFWGLVKELLDIAAHPVNFIEAVGKNIFQGAKDDWDKLNAYAVDRTVSGDFQAGRIMGRALYQVVMAILLVLSVAGAVAKIAARFPWLLRVARFIKSGGEMAELGEIAEGGKKAEAVVETISKSEADATAAKPKRATVVEPEEPPAESTPKAAAPRVEVRNGYTYTLDDKGRVTNVSGELSSNPAQGRNQAAQLAAGGEDRLPTDEGGHYVGRRFDGPTDDFNHFAQDMNFNRGEYKKLENTWQKALDNGSDVTVDITPSYTADSLRPDSIDVTYTIDGVPYQKTFLNQPGGGQ